MAKQQDPLRSIYNDLGLEQAGITYDKFSTKFMADSNARRSVYNDLGLEQAGVNYDLFEERLGVKKKELSQSASQSGVETFGQPSVPSPEFEASNARYANEADRRLAELSQPSVNLAQVDTSQFVDLTPEEMEAYGYSQPDENTTWSEFGTSIGNSLKNVWTSVKGFPADVRLVAGQGLEKLIGEKAASEFAAFTRLYDPNLNLVLFGGLPSVKASVASAYDELDRLSNEMLETEGLLDNIKKGDPLGFLAGAVNAISQLASTAIVSAPTAGAGLFVDMAAQSIHDYNNELAKEKGVSVRDLYLDGKSEYVVPAAIGMVGGLAEKVGFKGATKAILGELKGSVVRNAAAVALGSNKEGLTELFQHGLSEVNIGLANGSIKDVSDASKVFGKAIFSEDGLENYLGGFVGTASAAGISRVSRSVIGNENRSKADAATENILSLREELSNENLSPESRAVIEGAIHDNTKQLAEAVSDSSKIIDSADSAVKREIDTKLTRLEEIQSVLQDPNVSEVVKDKFKAEAESLSSEIDSLVDGIDNTKKEAVTDTEAQPETPVDVIADQSTEKAGEVEVTQPNESEVVTEVESEPQIVRPESEAKSGEYFTRDIGGEQTVYRRNEDGTASIVPDAEAQRVLTQQAETPPVSNEVSSTEATPQQKAETTPKAPISSETTQPTSQSAQQTSPTTRGAIERPVSKTVVDTPVSEIQTDEASFQNRESLDESRVQDIVDNFNEAALDPIVLYNDNGKTVVLSGHHRLAAAQKMGMETIPSRFFEGTKQQAIDFARDSNTLSRAETSTERASRYRDMRSRGETEASIREKARVAHGSDATKIINLSHLSESGKALEAINSFSESTDVNTKNKVEAIGDWIGNVKSRHPDLSTRQENEMFDYLMDKYGTKKKSGSVTSRAQFFDVANALINRLKDKGSFNEDAVLNLNNAAGKTGIELEYDQALSDAKDAVDAARKALDDARERAVAEGIRPDRMSELLSPLENNLRNALADEQAIRAQKSQLQEAVKAQTSIFDVINENEQTIKNDATVEREVQSAFNGEPTENTEASRGGQEVRQESPTGDQSEESNRSVRSGTPQLGESRRDRAGRSETGQTEKLEGAPNVKGATGPDPVLNEVARKYAESIGIEFNRQTEYVEVDVDRAERIAKAYDEMEHDPSDPAVKEAYENLIRQTKAQYDALSEAGYVFYFYDETNDPYNGSPWEAMRDLRGNKKMAVFATEAGYGSSATDIDVSDNPLLQDTGIEWGYGSPNGPKKRVTANDLFRAVHDAFGYGLEGAGFRARGEENAWQAHARLFTGSAIGALTTETRGQNSWLNYGPYGERNRNAKVEDTIFADQKTGLMPEWTWKEGFDGIQYDTPPVSTPEKKDPPSSKTKKPRTPKTLLKGIVDRLKKSGLASSVKLMNSEQIAEDLTGRTGIQLQASAWHGSPHVFDKFTTSKIGAGEGVQAFGWGLYFTQLKDIAENYAKVLGSGQMVTNVGNETLRDVMLSDRLSVEAYNAIINITSRDKSIKDKKSIIEALERKSKEKPSFFEKLFGKASKPEHFKEAANFFRDNVKEYKPASRNLYSVSLDVGNWLEYDKPASGDALKMAIKQAEKEKAPVGIFIELPRARTGHEMYKSASKILGGDKQASLFFNRAGIGGIKYPAESVSKGRTSENARGFNYVVFDENAVEIGKRLQFQNSPEGINGYVDGEGNVVINQDTAGKDTPIHEFAHLWEEKVAQDNPALHARGMELIKTEEGKPYVDHVKKTQPGLKGDALYREALAQAIGDRGAKLIESQKKSKIKEWLDAAWEYIGSLVGISGMTADQISKLTLNEFADAVAVDLLSGKPVSVAPNGDIVVDIQAEKKSDMNESEKRIADFMERMRNKNNIRFQGEVDPSTNRLSQEDLIEFITVAGDLVRLGKVKDFAELKSIANSIGITNNGDITAAWASAKNFVDNKNSTSGFKKAKIQTDLIGKSTNQKMSDAEYVETGKRIVDEGLVNPNDLVAELLEDGRVLQDFEQAALTYAKTQLDNRINENRAKLKKDPTNVDLRIEADSLFSLLNDYDIAIAVSGEHWSRSGRLRQVEMDKDYNAVYTLQEMDKIGEVPADVRARIEELGRELQEAKADLALRVSEIEALKEAQRQAGINSASSVNQRRGRMNTVARKDAVEVLDSLDLSSFGVSTMRFQTNGGLRFSIGPDSALQASLQGAVAKMKADIASGKVRLEDALESAINTVNSEVGEGNWNSIAFRSSVVNSFADKGNTVKPRKPYVGRDGKPVVPSAYLNDIVSAHRSANGRDMTIDEMVQSAKSELGQSFSDRDIRDSISGYGNATTNRMSDDRKNISTAKTIGRLQSRLEELESLGYSTISRQPRARQVNQEIEDLKKTINDMIDSLHDSDDYKSQMRSARENKKKYIQEYIKDVEERITAYRDANRRGEKIPDGYFSKKPKYDFTSDPEIIELERKREDMRNKLKEEVYRHRIRNRSVTDIMLDTTEQVLFNTTRMLTAGADLSAVLVQGGFITLSDPVSSVKALKLSVEKAGNKDLYDQYFHDLQRNPLFESARASKLNMQLPEFYQSIQEEQFGSQNIITKAYEYIIDKAFGENKKGAKKWKDGFPYSAAERQYGMFLTEIRFNLFEKSVNDAVNYFGIDINSDAGKDAMGRIAESINDMTMASNIKLIEGSSRTKKLVSMVMFSARKFAASWKLMYKVPYYGINFAINKGTSLVGGKTAAGIKSQTDFNAFLFQNLYGRYAGTAMGMVAATTILPTLIANGLYNPDEEEDPPMMYNPNVLNPSHSDFMKLRWGNTRVDMSIGLGGNIVFLTRLFGSGYMTSSDPTFKRYDENVAGFRNKSRGEVAMQYFANKLAPTPSIAYNYWFGKEHQRAETGDRIAESLYPMWLGGSIDHYNDTNSMGSTMAFLGMGILGLANNTYGGVEFSDHRGTNNSEARRIFERLLISDSTPERRTKVMYSPSSGVTKLQNSDFKQEYRDSYNEYMTSLTLAMKPLLLEKGLRPETVESMVNSMKSKAYKYAEVKATGVFVDEKFREVSDKKGAKFKLSNPQIKEKAAIIAQIMSSEKVQGMKSQLTKGYGKIYKSRGYLENKQLLDMDVYLELYDVAESMADIKMMDMIEKGKISPIPIKDYDKRTDNDGGYE